MTADNSDETFGPTDGDALEILAFLRSRVREYGFADADAALEMRLMDLGISAGNEALREYCHGFDSYMSVFEPESIGRTEELFSTNLSGGFSWRLLRGGDVERTSRFIDRDSIVVEDLSQYQRLAELRSKLRDVMGRFGIDYPDDAGNQPQPPFERPRNR